MRPGIEKLFCLLVGAALALSACASTVVPEDVTYVGSPTPTDLDHPTLPAVETSVPPTNLRPTEQVAGYEDMSTPPARTQPPASQPPPPPPPPSPAAEAPKPVATPCPPCDQFKHRIEYLNDRIANLERSNASLRQNANLNDPGIQQALAEDTATIGNLTAQRSQLEAQRAECEKQCVPPVKTAVQTPPASPPSPASPSPPPPPAPATSAVPTMQTPPATYQPTGQTALAPGYWYLCPNTGLYYPWQAQCSVPWVAVAPTAVQPAPPAIVPAFGIEYRFDIGGGRGDSRSR